MKELDISIENDITKNTATNALTRAISSVLILGILIGFIILSFSYIFIDVVVDGPSMQPTINMQWSILENHKKDTVYINRIASVENGDIIVAEASEGLFVIKRLIASAGDTIEIRQNLENMQVEVLVNAQIIEEDYVVFKAGLASTLSNFNNLKTLKPELFTGDVLTVPENHIFYLGDNRGESQDCSAYGPVEEEHLIGGVDVILPYGTNIFEYIWDGVVEIFN